MHKTNSLTKVFRTTILNAKQNSHQPFWRIQFLISSKCISFQLLYI